MTIIGHDDDSGNDDDNGSGDDDNRDGDDDDDENEDGNDLFSGGRVERNGRETQFSTRFVEKKNKSCKK